MKKPFVLGFSLIFFLVAGIPSLELKAQSRTVFGNEERRVIQEYYRGSGSNLPPGLAKRQGNLPPGLQKQLRRNGHLPPGLEKRVEPFPIDLERRLPTLPPIYRRGTIGDRAVIYDPMTSAILDIIQIITGGRR